MSVLPITGGFYESKSLPISHQECTNWYVMTMPPGSLADEVLFGTPGISQLATSGALQQINRGAHVKNGVPYFVNGTTLYSLTRTVVDDIETFTFNSLGTIDGTARVSMADNGTQLMVLVPDGKGYIYNESAGVPFAEITDADFTASGQPQHVVYIDGYFAVTTDSKKWIVSDLNDGLAWDALDFSTAEADPDIIVAPVVVQNQIYILGSQTTEGFQNIGGAGFPFQRNNVHVDKGCVAPYSVIKADNTFFMIGAGVDESPAVWQFTGSTYSKVSTSAIDYVLSTYTDTELAETYGWAYAFEGAYFIGFTLPDRTFVFELTTQRWHERKSYYKEVNGRWRVNSIVSAYGRILVGDFVDGRVGELGSDYYTEYDIDIIRIFSTQPFASEQAMSVPKLELTVETGVGNADVKDPVISLAISKDGRTFNAERNRSIGKIGEYMRRVVWRRNGWCAQWVVLRFRLSDAVKPVVIKLEAS